MSILKNLASFISIIFSAFFCSNPIFIICFSSSSSIAARGFGLGFTTPLISSSPFLFGWGTFFLSLLLTPPKASNLLIKISLLTIAPYNSFIPSDIPSVCSLISFSISLTFRIDCFISESFFWEVSIYWDNFKSIFFSAIFLFSSKISFILFSKSFLKSWVNFLVSKFICSLYSSILKTSFIKSSILISSIFISFNGSGFIIILLSSISSPPLAVKRIFIKGVSKKLLKSSLELITLSSPSSVNNVIDSIKAFLLSLNFWTISLIKSSYFWGHFKFSTLISLSSRIWCTSISFSFILFIKIWL